MNAPSVTLHRLSGEYVVARFPPSADVRSVLGDQITAGAFASVTRTPHEISVVCPSESAPADARIDGPWVAHIVGGPIAFETTGIVTSLVSPLSAIGCPVFVTSTFDGDVLMFPVGDASRAEVALRDAGHVLV